MLLQLPLLRLAVSAARYRRGQRSLGGHLLLAVLAQIAGRPPSAIVSTLK